MAPWLPGTRRMPSAGEELGGGVRVLGDADTPGLRALVDRDPVAHLFMDSQLEATGTAAPSSTGSLVLGRFDGNRLAAACWVGMNIVPVEASPEDATAFADAILPLERRFSSVFGDARTVLSLWSRLQDGPQRAFDIRASQPLMRLDRAPEPGPGVVRRTREEEYDVVLPACAAMFQEELGYSPLAGGGSYYRARVRTLIRQGHSFVDLEPSGRVRFKAELGTVSPRATQIQGVWLAPQFRGLGLAAGYMASVARHALELAPVTSLYVNDYNTPALATYRRVGFHQVGEFATILF
ncbi:GNAT family N-acetyltransferase [Zafaria sp. Z1313]|uniref:GNAT family N-acetyltransferase n=1 Tax=unclassified Zafaria TaxID=2828765 RepID=UPI002E76C28E|nr:GNAT family N-acetyltransferase [Zafaria sp. J156]MEE1620096.1 GNAT family N-acetyltransferase [Zafaria sp. J156]